MKAKVSIPGPLTFVRGPSAAVRRGMTSTLRCLLWLSCVLPAAGCVTTVLEPPHIDPGLLRLQESATFSTPVEVSAALDSSSLGSQFFLLFVPMGQVRLASPDLFVWDAALRVFGPWGYRVQPAAAGSPSSSPRATLVLTDAGVTAYDFLFMRRIVASVTVELACERRNGSTPPIAGDGRFTVWKEFAFRTQLQYAFEKALQDAIRNAAEHAALHPEQGLWCRDSNHNERHR